MRTYVREQNSLPEDVPQDSEVLSHTKDTHQDVCHAANMSVSEPTKFIEEALATELGRQALLQLGEEETANLVDELQIWLDEQLHHPHRPHALRLLVQVVAKGDYLPQSLYVTGVTLPDGRDPCKHGGFADIFRGSLHERFVAVKKLRSLEAGGKIWMRFCREALVWKQLHHPFILPLIGIDKETFALTGFICMISPWMLQGTIIEYLRNCTNASRESMLLDIAIGLAYLHSQNLVHADIRPANVLVDTDGKVRTADFGLCMFSQDPSFSFGTTDDQAGATHYLAPERLECLSASGSLLPRSCSEDVYSFGCLCIEVYTFLPPYPNLHPFGVVLRVLIQGESPQRPLDHECQSATIGDELWVLISRCLSRDPKLRLQTEDLVVCMKQLIKTKDIHKAQDGVSEHWKLESADMLVYESYGVKEERSFARLECGLDLRYDLDLESDLDLGLTSDMDVVVHRPRARRGSEGWLKRSRLTQPPCIQTGFECPWCDTRYDREDLLYVHLRLHWEQGSLEPPSDLWEKDDMTLLLACPASLVAQQFGILSFENWRKIDQHVLSGSDTLSLVDTRLSGALEVHISISDLATRMHSLFVFIESEVMSHLASILECCINSPDHQSAAAITYSLSAPQDLPCFDWPDLQSQLKRGLLLFGFRDDFAEYRRHCASTKGPYAPYFGAELIRLASGDPKHIRPAWNEAFEKGTAYWSQLTPHDGILNLLRQFVTFDNVHL